MIHIYEVGMISNFHTKHDTNRKNQNYLVKIYTYNIIVKYQSGNSIMNSKTYSDKNIKLSVYNII